MRASSILVVLLAACGRHGLPPAALQPQVEYFTAGAAGGTFRLAGGIEVEFPAGAVGEEVEFRFERLDASMLPVLSTPFRPGPAFRILGRPVAAPSTPQLASVPAYERVPLMREITIRVELASVPLSKGEEYALAFLASVQDDDAEPLEPLSLRGGLYKGLYTIDGKSAETGTYLVIFGIGRIRVEAEENQVRVEVEREADLTPIDLPLVSASVSDDASLLNPRMPGDSLGTVDEITPVVGADWEVRCGSGGSYTLSVEIDLEPQEFMENPPLPGRIMVALEAPVDNCGPDMGANDRDGDYVILTEQPRPEEIRRLPPDWIDTDGDDSMLIAIEGAVVIASLIDTTKPPRTISNGGQAGALYGAFPLADPTLAASLAQVAPPNPQTLVYYGSAGGFLREYTPGQGFGVQTISLGSQYTHGAPMNNDPMSGIGVLTNSIQGNIRLVGAFGSGTLLLGIPGQIKPTGFPAGTGSLFCTYMRTTAKTLVVTRGSPGAVWIIKDLGFPVVTKLADTQDDPRRISVLDDIVVISNFGSDSLSIYRWNADDTFTLLGHEPVCDGPVGIDVKKLADGRFAIVSTGFNDDCYAITVVDPADDSVTSGPRTAVFTGCQAPGHAIWVPDEDEDRIVVSCNASGDVVSHAVSIPD